MCAHGARLVTAPDDLTRQVRRLLDGPADHEGRHLDLVPVEQVEQPRDALVDAVLEEGVGSAGPAGPARSDPG